MQNNGEEEPFWLQPPWVILTDTLKLKKINLWNIEIDYLVKGFLEKMLLQEIVNFRVSGLALFSASLLYRWKTETLLKREEEEDPSRQQIEEEFKLLPPIIPPFRHTSRGISIGELLVALEKVLKEEASTKRRSLIKKNILENIQPLVYAIDPDRTQIERTLKNIYDLIKKKAAANKIVKFSDLLPNRDRMEIVKVFFCVLLLGFRGYIDLWQEEDYGEIFLTLLKDTDEIILGEPDAGCKA
ncbi:MAG: hypothetical protein OdinLCB4_005405 [Candidatus Odinarchaeum yellowstonii]|uniref:Rad21/Rec8-like protein C-terminal eukaryotic domain-containing protein n=1 Tax=Odinarchaeota yellowstonii (strain LCB_4) TaxID=1841599 RepID=A0AAF0D1C7_ODILC|nr:MAG: hypothetical protein OdinLCB4_005405 [Candidatus Odinarchaeum yellowstonii]